MTPFHVDAIFRQFPVLQKHFGRHKRLFTHGSVQRMDMHFLHMTTGLNVSDEEHAMRDVFLLDVSGNILSHVGFNHWYDLWNLLRFHLLSILFRGSGRRVEAALRSLGEQAKQCELAVVTYHGIAAESSITVYKVPKGYSSAFDLFEIKRLKIAADIYRARRDIMKDSNT